MGPSFARGSLPSAFAPVDAAAPALDPWSSPAGGSSCRAAPVYMPAGESALGGTPGSSTSGLGYAVVAVVALGAIYLMVRSTEGEERDRRDRLAAARRAR